MKILSFFFLSLIPLFSSLGFTVQSNQEFCIYYQAKNGTAGYVVFHPERYNDNLIEFKASTSRGEEIVKNFEKTYAFHESGEYKFCTKNLEYQPKNATIFFNLYNTSLPADVGDVYGMEYFTDKIFENLNVAEEGVKTRDQMSVYQGEQSASNIHKLNVCLIMKIMILFVIMVLQICVLRYFVSKGKH